MELCSWLWEDEIKPLQEVEILREEDIESTGIYLEEGHWGNHSVIQAPSLIHLHCIEPARARWPTQLMTIIREHRNGPRHNNLVIITSEIN